MTTYSTEDGRRRWRLDTAEARAERTAVERYRHTLARERLIGRRVVERMLDDTCLIFGLDPYETWRKPRLLDKATKMEAMHAQLRADLAKVRRANRPRDERGRWVR